MLLNTGSRNTTLTDSGLILRKDFTNTPGDGRAYDASRIAILKRIYDKIKLINAGAYMICEHFAANSEEKELVGLWHAYMGQQQLQF